MTETQPEHPCFTWNLHRVIENGQNGVAVFVDCRKPAGRDFLLMISSIESAPFRVVSGAVPI
jgi:hypothetical protein